MPERLVTPVAEEFRTASLGDKRLERRLGQIASAAERAPNASFPQRAGGSAALEGTYQFFANSKVTPEALFDAHSEARR